MRIIGHLDMDAFFASIEERNNPRFAGLPIVVGADPQNGHGRGVVSTANYKAREYGIRSAMPITQAWHLSTQAQNQGKPAAIFLSGSFGTYGPISRKIMAIIQKYCPNIEKRSIDEAYFDLTFTGSMNKAIALCKKIKMEIEKQERLTSSIGIGPNKLIAKIASDFKKPGGLTVVEEKDTQSFLKDLPIRVIPGIGPKTAHKLNKLGVTHIKDLQEISKDHLEKIFGKWGIGLYYKSRGQDESPLSKGRIAKSIGQHHTLHQDTLQSNILIEKLIQSCHNIHERLINENFNSFRTVVITVRFNDFQTLTRSHTLPKPTQSCDVLQHETIRLFLPFLDHRENPGHKSIRLVGVRLEKLD